MADAGYNEPEPSAGSESTNSSTANPLIPEIRREKEIVSLLDRLRSPAASELSRKRKLSVNTPGNRRSQTSVSRKANEPMKVSASQGVQEFKEDSFVGSRKGTLFCQSCREELSLKAQNIAKQEAQEEQKEDGEPIMRRSTRNFNIPPPSRANPRNLNF